MACCSNDCSTYTSDIFYDGAYIPSAAITPDDNLNVVISKIITYVGSAAALNITAGAGIQVVKIGNNYTITNSSQNVIQTLSLSGSTISLSNSGGSVTLPTYTQQNADWNATSGVTQILNKPVIAAPQTLTYNSSTGSLSISAGNSVTIPTSVYSAGTGISISGSVISNSAPNITQLISLSGTTLTLSGSGGSVSLPTGTGIIDDGKGFGTTQTAYNGFNTGGGIATGDITYVSTSSLLVSSYASTHTFVLNGVSTLNLPAASTQPLGREIEFKIRANPNYDITLSGATIRHFAATLSTLSGTDDAYLRIKTSTISGVNYWELIDKHDITI